MMEQFIEEVNIFVQKMHYDVLKEVSLCSMPNLTKIHLKQIEFDGQMI